MEKIEPPAANAENKSRPILITIICLLSLLGVFYVIPMIVSEKARSIGSWYPTYLAIASILGVITMAGLWLMKKWAVYLYTSFVVCNQIVLLVMGIWNINAIILPSVIIAIGFVYLERMD